MGTGFLEEVPEQTPHAEPHGNAEGDLGREQLELGCEVGGRVGAQGGWSHREGRGWWVVDLGVLGHHATEPEGAPAELWSELWSHLQKVCGVGDALGVKIWCWGCPRGNCCPLPSSRPEMMEASGQ